MAIQTECFASTTALEHGRSYTSPTLPRPGECQRPAVQFIVAIYTRYSTDEQKEKSITRQIMRCTGYYRANTTAIDHLLFADRGYSGALLEQRPDLMALMELVKYGKVTDIVIEDFDRLSRDIYDAMLIGRLMELNNVRLHIANLGRCVSRAELVEEAKRAEADRHRRTELLSCGIDQLVEEGGVPWGATFGYKDGDRPGFPVVCEIAAAAIRRLFELSIYFSDVATAQVLKAEGFISPNGTTEWTSNTVANLRCRLLFIGVINYRQTDRARRRVKVGCEEAPPGDLTTKTKLVKKAVRRPTSQWIVGYNKAYEIVDEALFLAVQMAKGFRRKSPPQKPRERDMVHLFAHPICDCPKRMPNQKFVSGGPQTGELVCSRDSKLGDCQCRHARRVKTEDVQRVVVDLLRLHIGPLLDDRKYLDTLK